MAKVLMIEDDLEYAALLADFLSRYNIELTNYDDPFLGLSSGISDFDLVILDLSLPGMDGLEVCQKIVKYNDTPIIVSSARHNLQDKVAALGYGADDYIKPYDPQELYARILSLLRRYKKVHDPKEEAKAELLIDDSNEKVTFNGEILLLTPAEYEVLRELYRHKGAIVSREQIFGASTLLQESSSKSLDVMINRLRHKMRDSDKQYIRSLRGVGYKLTL